MNTVLFCETPLLYVPARVSIGVLFPQPAWRVRAHACAVNVNHEEGLLQPRETIATVTGLNMGVNVVRKMVHQKT